MITVIDANVPQGDPLFMSWHLHILPVLQASSKFYMLAKSSDN